mmetsp:Transcript_28673/g.96206  ORF Transcript_28673/g.96206 Transcript_28673/m.96206 type:complete len:262 (-) Transcript_28673:138-923(-)
MASSREREPTLVNCLMLVRWPQRREMVQAAVASFVAQDHPNRTLTVVNDGAPCALSAAFFACGVGGRVLQMPSPATLGEKRNAGVAAVPEAAYSASFDDDDVSLPERLSANLRAMRSRRPPAAFLAASRKYIAIGAIDNIVGFELGRCYGAGMVAADVTDALRWPSQDCFEDHSVYEAVVSHAELGLRVAEADELLYVHRRHGSNVTAPHRKDMWQGVLPLQLAGPSATAAPERVRAMLQRHAGVAFLVDSEAGGESTGAT